MSGSKARSRSDRSGPGRVDAYMADFPDDVRRKLERIRRTILKVAPGAKQRVSYGIPAFDLDGRPLIYFAGYAKHIGIYPAPRGYDEFREELAAYEGGKGTVRFPLRRPIPYDLIRRIVQFRMERISEGAGK